MKKKRLLRRIALMGFAAAVCAGLTPAVSLAQTEGVMELKQELETLREKDAKTQEHIRSLERKINQLLENQAAAPAAPIRQTAPPDIAIDKALEEAGAVVEPESAPPAGQDIASERVGSTELRLMDTSFSFVGAAGWSTENDESLNTLQGGAHDPKKRGFTLQQAELSLGGAVDPYFTGEAHIVFLEGEGVETEEAFLTTRALPYNLELEAGYFLTEFGRINTLHAHDWDWMDQPVINTRMFGGDGQRAAGFRLAALLPTPWYSEFHLGMQNSGGEFMPSFRGGEIGHSHGEGGHGHEEEHDHAHAARTLQHHEDHPHKAEDHEHEHHEEEMDHEHGAHEEEHHEEEMGHEHDEHEAEHDHEDEHDHSHELASGDGIGGRPIVDVTVDGLDDFVYLARLDNFFDITDSLSAKLGFSGLYGPNSTGREGYTAIYGADLVSKWIPTNNFRGYPYVTFQSEVIARHYKADGFTLEEEIVGEDTLKDWGFYAQLMHGFTYGWAVGMRSEYATGSGESIGGRENDVWRDNRLRLSPLLTWRLSEFSRLRLQYNYDHADHIVGSDAHSVWIGFDAILGTHPAHRY